MKATLAFLEIVKIFVGIIVQGTSVRRVRVRAFKRVDKTQEECNRFEDNFLYMMKNLPTFVETPELWDDDYFQEMMQEAEYANMTEQERWEYALAMKHKWDYQNTIDYARKEGKIDVAKQMLADNVPVETVLKYTGLTEEQVRAL